MVDSYRIKKKYAALYCVLPWRGVLATSLEALTEPLPLQQGKAAAGAAAEPCSSDQDRGVELRAVVKPVTVEKHCEKGNDLSSYISVSVAS